MKTIEHRSIDKSTWADGPWHFEPDKRQWLDEATSLPCLILRNEMGGNLCGYVGIPPTHPAWGLHYDGVTDQEARDRMTAWHEDVRRWVAAGSPPLKKWWARKDRPVLPPDDPVPGIGDSIAAIEVHGGLSYADMNDTPTVERWQALQGMVPQARVDAARYPEGDAAIWLRLWEKAFNDYQAFVERVLKTGLCFDLEPDEPELWIFGFDCAHAFDIVPALDAMMEKLKMRAPTLTPQRHSHSKLPDTVYRDLAYVEKEVVSLAKALAAMYVGEAFFAAKA